MGIILQVENDFNGIRIDRFIGNKINLTHSIICKLLRDKKILLNDKNIFRHSLYEVNDIFKHEVVLFTLKFPYF